MITRPLDQPPSIVDYLPAQLSAIRDVATLDRLETAERAGSARKTVLTKIEARRRVLVRENGAGRGLSPESLATSAELVDLMAASDRAAADLPIGLHQDVPFPAYERIDAASNTRLSWLKKSPAHLKAYLEEPPTFIDPESIGTALHCLILEPDVFPQRYAGGPVDDKRKPAWKEFVAGLPSGAIGLRANHWDAVHRMRENILAHPAARAALDGVTARELTGVWTDPATGLRCKLRTDGINPDLGATIDLKSTTDAEEWAFRKSLWTYGYHRQAAFYGMGMMALVPEVEWRHRIIIAVEKERPFAVQAFRIRDDAIRQGEDEIGRLLPRYGECMATDHFPAYADTFVDVALPPWADRAE